MRCLRCGVADGCGGKEAKVVVVWLWLFGNDVGGGDLVVGGVVLGMKVRRWCGVVDGCGDKGAKVVVVWLWTFGSDVGGGIWLLGASFWE